MILGEGITCLNKNSRFIGTKPFVNDCIIRV